MAGITVEGLTPFLKMLAASQHLVFGTGIVPVSLAELTLDNMFTPTVDIPSITNFGVKNKSLSGFRWVHTTNSSDTFGSLKLQSFINDQSTGIDILLFNQNGTVSFTQPVTFPGFVVSNDFDMAGFKITNLAAPVDPNDGVNKAYADSLVSNLPAIVNIDGASETFLYSSNYDASFITKNTTVPIVGNNSTINYKMLNSSNGGYKLTHTIASAGIGGGLGTLSVDAISTFGNVINFINFGFSSLTAGPGVAGGVPNTTFGAVTEDSLLATVSVNGGVQNVPNESTCFRAISSDNSTKIELKNIASNGHLYELRSNSDGSFNILDRTLNVSRFDIGVDGNIIFNWAYDSSVNPAPYQLINRLNDSQVSKNFKYRVLTDNSSVREWNHDYTLIGNSDLNGIYQLNYKALSSTYTPLSIAIYPFASSQNLMSITVPLDMGGFEVRNALNPTTPQSLATKSYVDSAMGNNLNLPRLGIGLNPSVDGRIQFANILMDNKISLFNNTGNDYNQSGLGYSALGTLYHAPLSSSHTFYLGNNTTIPLRVNALGIQISELRPIDSDYRRIMFYDEGENLHQIYNIGIKTLDGTNHAIHSQVSNFQAAFTWGYGLTSVSSFELMRLDNNKLIVNNGKLTISESTNLTSWDLTPISNGEFSLGKSDVTVNKFTFTSNALSSTFSILNPDSSAVSYFKVGTNTDSIELGYDGLNDYSFFNLVGSSNDRFAFRVNGTGIAALLSNGRFGLGTINPTTSQFQINGGVQNIPGEESAIRVVGGLNSIKVELQNTAAGGKLYELRSRNNGSFDITDRTSLITRYSIDTNGNHVFSNTIYGRRPSGLYYMEGNATPTALIANIWAKIAGITTNVSLNQFTTPINNRIQYIGTAQTPIIIAVTAAITCNFSAGGGTTTRSVAIFKNGVQVIPSVMSEDGASGLNLNLSTSTSVSMATNDYIEVFIRSSNNTNVTVSNLILNITTT